MPKISLKAARVNAGLNQKQAAEKLMISVATLRNWEAGKSFPNQRKIEAICAVYGISYDALFFA